MGFMAVAHSFAHFAAIAVLGGLGNSVFHPADFAILNASVDSRRLGRAFSIHGLGGSLGWAGGPAMYFLDSAVGLLWRALRERVPGIPIRLAAATLSVIAGVGLATLTLPALDHLQDDVSGHVGFDAG